jgi:formylmethanofuran dehydrogenase subunit C
MSDAITLRLRTALTARLEVDGLTADRLATLGEPEIANLPVLAGRDHARLGDFFEVRGGHTATVRLAGDLSRLDGIAEGMTGGELVVDGDAGDRLGARMTGGTVRVTGAAGDAAGASMAGGLLRIGGDAGDRLGAAAPGASKGMSGGEILVGGAAGIDAAARLRRGLIVVGGSTGPNPGRAMIAGTLIVFGDTGDHPGRGNKRGSLVALGGIAVPSTYRYACTYRPPHLRLTLTHLRRRHGLAIDDAVIDGTYRRYCGDAGDPGKGEILERVRS